MTTTPADTSLDPVASTTLEGSVTAPPDFSMLGMFWEADWVVKLVILLLLGMSFYCWAIIIEKWVMIKNARRKAKQFEQEFWAADALDKLHDRSKKRANHPMIIMFVAAMDEWFRSKGGGGSAPASMRANIRDRINQIMSVARNREMDKLESGLGFLATTGSSAPFIGLFGTVWGIMNSFTAIAVSQNTSLIAVAPGIAEALFATAIGLFAAIPAVIFYNKLSNQITRFAGELEDFSVEFNTILSRQLDN